MIALGIGPFLLLGLVAVPAGVVVVPALIAGMI